MEDFPETTDYWDEEVSALFAEFANVSRSFVSKPIITLPSAEETPKIIENIDIESARLESRLVNLPTL